MKKTGRILIVVLVMTATLLMTATTALAVTAEWDGVSLTLTTDRESYDIGDVAEVGISLANANSHSVTDTRITLTLPDALRLRTGAAVMDVGTVGPGETRDYTVTATVTEKTSAADIAASAQPTKTTAATSAKAPKTADDTPLLPWIILAVAAAVAAGVWVYRGKARVGKLFALLLCLAAAACVAVPSGVALAASKTVVKNLYTADNNDDVIYKIEAELDYRVVGAITLNSSRETLRVGDTFDLVATVENPGLGDKIMWKSSDPAVASVDSESGKVTGAAVGQATITVRQYDQNDYPLGEASCIIDVVPADAADTLAGMYSGSFAGNIAGVSGTGNAYYGVDYINDTPTITCISLFVSEKGWAEGATQAISIYGGGSLATIGSDGKFSFRVTSTSGAKLDAHGLLAGGYAMLSGNVFDGSLSLIGSLGSTAGAVHSNGYGSKTSDVAPALSDLPVPPAIRYPGAPPAIDNGATTDTISLVEGYAAYDKTYTVSGWPAPATAMDAAGNTAGASIAGGTLTIPAGLAPGSYTANFTATNSEGTANMAVTVNVAAAAAIEITTTSLPAWTQDHAYSRQIATSGGAGAKTFTVDSGALPTGLSLSSGGLISGTPTANGTYTFVIKVIDSAATPTSDTQGYTVVVNPPLFINPSSGFLTGTAGTPFNGSIEAVNGTAPYTYALTGTLPVGLSFSTTTGAITGTPAAAGSYTGLTATVTDATGATDTISVEIQIG